MKSTKLKSTLPVMGLLIVLVAGRLAPPHAAASEAAKGGQTVAKKSAGIAADKARMQAELAKWDNPAAHLPSSGPGGTAWDAHYRSFIQTDESATSKGFPTHAEAAKAILADAGKGPENLRTHTGWVLFIRHHSQPYRPDSATADLKRLYENLVALEFSGTPARSTLPFEGDSRLIVYRDVVYGRSHPEIQKLDAYLVKSNRPTPVLIEIHGGGWRRGRIEDGQTSSSRFSVAVCEGDDIPGRIEASIRKLTQPKE